MDIITQGLLGAVMAQSAAPREDIRRASVIGFTSGVLADADILIRSSSDPLMTLEYHRHFTHALLFIPVGAFVAALFLFPFLRKRLSFKRVYLYALPGYLFSGVLDACTSYGTHLFWPFTEEPIALNLIAIIDPVFTGLLLLGFAWAFIKGTRHAPRAALVLCVFYLGLAAIQANRAAEASRDLASRRGHAVTRMLVKPTLGNIVLWRSVYIASNRIHVDAVRVGMPRLKIYPGASLPLFEPNRDAKHILSPSLLRKDIRRFQRFSAGYIAVHPELPNILGDIRYSMLPNSTRPLWGITLDALRPNMHADYKTFRVQSREDRRRFFDMLAGLD